ncbi:hypothetical protein [Rhodopirellula sp. MGV]|uniref:hypothetical protein n=1 Tax=Rhodopirellula sp. MGV TaxID=2023130 RepID=UPI00117A2AF0|nr:hypothetical protein [Rhodopirellula sp. MGV]
MNPLELFRRNQKVMMTGLILLAMFAFVVLPAVSQYMRSSGPGMTDPVLAEFDGVSLTASRVGLFTRNHYATVQYLRKLAQLTVARGGTPTLFTVDPQSQQVQAVGIQQTPSEELSIRTLQFSSLAQQKGLELDDTSIRSWLDRFTSGLVTERERYALLRQETNNQMGEYQLLDMLRKQLLAQLYFQAADASVSMGGMPVASPLEHWNNFLKLNQQASVAAYGVLVNDFISKTDENPSESTIVALYEAGKERYPSDQSPEPGFRRRDSASFEYLLADLQAFRDAEAAKLSDEEIRAEYEKRKEGGAFVLPPDVIVEPTVEMPATEETPSAEEAASEEAMTEGEAEPAATEPAATEPAEAAEEEMPAEETPAEEAPTAAETFAAGVDGRMEQVESFTKEIEEASKLDDQPAATEAEEPAAETEEAAAEAAATEDQSANTVERAVQLVALQEPASDETAAEADAPVADEAPADEAPADEAPADEAPADEAPADEAPADEAPADEAPAAEEAAADETRYQPFEDVRDQIVESMVEAPAREARDAALAKARAVMKQYFSARALAEGDAEPPVRPNLEALAKELGLKHRQIGPHTIVSLQNEPIGESVDESTALTRQAIPFGLLMFGYGEQIIKQPLFRPVDTVDLGAELHYLTWKTEEAEAYIPELDEIRKEVIQAIRVQEARKLAQQEAEAIAKQVNEGKKLADLVPEDRQDNFYAEVGPFSWYNMVGFRQYTIGNVPQLDSVGPEFMEAAFNTEDGKAAVAKNVPERVFYVVRRERLQPTSSELHTMFQQPGQRIMATLMPSVEATDIQEGFYDKVDEESSFSRFRPEAL